MRNRHTLCAAGLVILLTGIPIMATAQEAGDEAEMQERIDALGADGGVVTLEARTYVLKHSIMLPSSVTLKGAGMDRTTLVLADGVNDSVVRGVVYDKGAMIGAHDVTLADLTVDGNGAHNNSHFGGVKFEYTYNYRIENVRVKDAPAIGAIFTNPTHTIYNKEQKNYIVGCIVENTLENKPSLGAWPGNGIWVTGFRDNNNVLIKGNVVRNSYATGIFIEDGIDHIFIEDNDVHDNGQHGIWLCGVSDSAVRRNRIYRNTRGIHATGYCAKTVFADNLIYDNRLEGICFGYWGFAEHFKDTVTAGNGDWYNLVIGNTIRNNNRDYIEAGPGVLIETRGNVIAFNHIYDDQEHQTQFVGIWLGAPGNVVINNYLRPGHHAVGADMIHHEEHHNTVVPWDYDKPWTPQNLVSWYGSTWED